MTQTSIDAGEIWKRVGLENLRLSLTEVRTLAGEFEQALKNLPECDQCAQRALIDQIEKTGGRLSEKTISLSLLANSLEQSLTAAREIKKRLCANAPSPCVCKGGKCSCH